MHPMQIWRILAASCLLATLATGVAHAQRAAVEEAGKAQLGVNLAGIADWAPELPFVDVFRNARIWVIDGAYDRDLKQRDALDYDEHGWPRRVPEGTKVVAFVLTVAHYPPGVYTLLYDGEGELEVTGKGSRVVERAAGRVLVDVPAGADGPLSIRLVRTEPGNHVRNIRFVMPGFEGTYEQDRFHPNFLERWRGVSTLRFMDWQETNGSTLAKWDDRPDLADASWMNHGVPVEVMIEAANRLDADPWFCMPHLADDDFVRRFATLVHERLEPELTAYVEYSNEVWNWQFAQARYADQKAKELGFDQENPAGLAKERFTSMRSVEIFGIWEEVFGGLDRLVRVMPGHSGSRATNETLLSFRDAYRHTDALAGAPYMPFTLATGQRPAAEDLVAQGYDVDRLLDLFEETAVEDAIERRFANDREVAERFGVKLIAYEGGQHMVPRSKTKDQEAVRAVSRLMQEANLHPRMGEIYRRYLAAWEAIGGGVFCHFSSVGNWGVHGYWGVANRYDAAPGEYPKYEAVLEWANAQGQPMRPLAPGPR